MNITLLNIIMLSSLIQADKGGCGILQLPTSILILNMKGLFEEIPPKKNCKITLIIGKNETLGRHNFFSNVELCGCYQYPRVSFQPPEQSHASYQASALPPSHRLTLLCYSFQFCNGILYIICDVFSGLVSHSEPSP